MLARASHFDVPERKIDAAINIAGMLRAQSARIDRERSVPRDVIEQLHDAGLFGMLKPRRFGGERIPLKDAMAISRELAAGDASTAWIHSVFLGHDYIVGLFPLEAQEDFWGSAETPLCSSSVMPTGKAVAVDGGWELSGGWSFCSGIDHANWTLLGAITGMLPGEPPMPERRLFMVPASDYTIVDDWHVGGLRGTGSKSIRLDAVFVPAARVLRDADIGDMTAPGLGLHDANEYRYPTWSLLSFALVGLASRIARNAYDHGLGEIRAGNGKPNPLFEARRSAAALHLAEASAKIDAAELLFSRAFDDTFAIVAANEELTMPMRVRNRRDQCFAAQLSLQAVSTMLGIGGARGIREGGVVQRAARDLDALTLHPGSNWDTTALSFGTFSMGGAPADPMV